MLWVHQERDEKNVGDGLTMVSNCKVTKCQPGSLPAEILQQYSILTDLYIVSDIKSQINLDLTKYHLSQLTNSGDLYEIITKRDAESYLEATPSDRHADSEDFHINKLILRNNTLKLYLQEQSYKSIPSLSNVGIVKKLKDSKVGHGAKHYVNYSHSIEINLSTGIKSQVKYVLQTIFSKCDIITNIPIDSNVVQSTHRSQALNQNLNLSPIFNQNDDLSDLYEYLILLNMNSNQLLMNNDTDDYLSTYEVPTSESTPQMSLTLNHYINISGKYLQGLFNENWLCINAYTFSGHILLLKSPVDKSIIIWELHR